MLKSKPQTLLQLGGRSSVPQLIDTDGVRYSESLDIMYWSLRVSNDNCLSLIVWPNCLIKRNKIMSWIRYNDIFFKYWLDRYKYADRFPEFEEVYYRRKGEVFLQRLEQRLSRQEFLCADQVSLADISIFPFIRQFSAVRSEWFRFADYPYLKVWLNVFLDSSLFQQVMTKHLAWNEGQEEVVFP